jgi:hypothetical protein
VESIGGARAALHERRVEHANRKLFRVAAQFCRRACGTPPRQDRYYVGQKKPEEERMPLLPIILWVGVPVVLLGGGYWIVHTMH